MNISMRGAVIRNALFVWTPCLGGGRIGDGCHMLTIVDLCAQLRHF